jgi:hypothetical protein
MFWLTSWKGWAVVVAGVGWLVNAIALPTPWDALSWLLCALLFVYGMFGGAELLRCVVRCRILDQSPAWCASALTPFIILALRVIDDDDGWESLLPTLPVWD